MDFINKFLDLFIERQYYINKINFSLDLYRHSHIFKDIEIYYDCIYECKFDQMSLSEDKKAYDFRLDKNNYGIKVIVKLEGLNIYLYDYKASTKNMSSKDTFLIFEIHKNGKCPNEILNKINKLGNLYLCDISHLNNIETKQQEIFGSRNKIVGLFSEISKII